MSIDPHYNPKVKAHILPDSPLRESTPSKNRGSLVDPGKEALFSVTKPVHEIDSIGNLPRTRPDP